MAAITKEDQLEFIGQVVDVFEEFLEEKGVSFKCDEKKCCEDSENEEAVIIDGENYDNLQNSLKELFTNWQVFK